MSAFCVSSGGGCSVRRCVTWEPGHPVIGGGRVPASGPLARPAVVLVGGVGGVLWPVEEDRDRCLVRAGQPGQCRPEAELVADLESDWAAVQVDPVDGRGARFVGTRLRYRAVGGAAGP